MDQNGPDFHQVLSCGETCKLTVLLLFIGVNMLAYVGMMQLYHEEPRRALIAQEMILNRNFTVPTVYSETYLKKPPLHNWIIAALAYPSGVVTNMDARLPSVISVLLLGWSVFFLLKQKSRSIAFKAAVISVTSYVILISYGNKAEPDMLLTLLTFLSYAVYVRAPLYPMAVFVSSFLMGLGILTKGLSPIFFYPGIILFVALYGGSKRKKHFLMLFVHFVLSLIPPLVWIIMYSRNADLAPLLDTFFKEGYTRVEAGFTRIIVHALVFPFRAFLALLPWSLLVFWIRRNPMKDQRDPIFRSSWIILLCTLVIMTLTPGGRGRYFMPATPFFGIVLAFLIPDEFPIRRKLTRRLFEVFSVLFVTGAVYIALKGLLLQAFILLLLAGTTLILKRKSFTVFNFTLTSSLLMFLFYMHCVYVYRAVTHCDCRSVAERIVQTVGETDIPYVVDPDVDPIKLMLNIERLTGHQVYRYRSSDLNHFIYISKRKACNGCRRIISFRYSKKLPELFVYECWKKMNTSSITSTGDQARGEFSGCAR